MPRESRSEAIDRLPNEPYDAGSGIALCSTNLFSRRSRFTSLSPFAHIRGNDAPEPAWPDDASPSLNTPRKPKQLCLTFFFGDPTITCPDQQVDEKFRLRAACSSRIQQGLPGPAYDKA